MAILERENASMREQLARICKEGNTTFKWKEVAK